ncbi:MAG: peptidylprolyl isomerase [Acidobacteriia bacterium]|nr:peptidylprolyl isomerase [Terriglobia bacterium]
MKRREVRQKCRVLGGLLLAGMLAGAAYGQGQSGQNPPALVNATTPASSDKVVLKVGSEQITQADLDFVISTLNPQAQQSLAQQGRRTLGDQYAMMVLLSQVGLSHHLDAAPGFQRELALQKRQALAQAEYRELLRQAAPSTEEVNQYFSSHQSEFEEAQIREAIVMKKQAGGKDDTPGLPAEEAKAKADAIRKALVAGTDAAKVGEQFNAPNMVRIDPEPRAVRRGNLRPEMEKAAFELKPGEVSEVFDLPQALVILQVVGRHAPELKAATPQIENSLRQQKVEAALANLKKSTNIWLDESYFTRPAPAAPAAAPPAASAQPPAKNPPPQP